MTTTPMKRAGQLIAHLDILHQIRDVRQLLLLQLSMRERQDQVALFRRQEGVVTLSLIGQQPGLPTEMLSHRAGSVAASVLLEQLQTASGIRGDDVAFSAGQIGALVDTETVKIEQSEGLARLDAALLGLVNRLEQQQEAAEPVRPAASVVQDAELPAPAEPEASEPVAEAQPEPAVDALEPASEDEAPELVADVPASRSGRRRA